MQDNHSQNELQPSEYERLRTWICEIAKVLLGDDAAPRDEGRWRNFKGSAGLVINLDNGGWYHHSTGRGGYSPLALIEYLGRYDRDATVTWARAWLVQHPGTGSVAGRAEDDDDASPPSKAEAEDIRAKAVDIAGTAAETYLRSRKLDAPFPEGLKSLPYARCGEGALVAPMYSHGRIVGFQAGYITPDGKKSLVEPYRRRFMLENAPDAVFLLPFAGENTDVVVCEGIEDAISVWRWAALRCQVIGLPGIGTLRHLTFDKGVKVTVVCDGDAPGSAAAKGLAAGIDALLLAGTDVFVTEAPPGGLDANAILQEAGVDGLKAFIATAHPGELSIQGRIEQLAAMPILDYELARAQAAKDLGIRASVLDDLVTKARAAAKPAADDFIDIDDTPPWPDTVDGAELLDEIVASVSSFVIMTKEEARAISLWILFTHAFEAASCNPKLWVHSPEKRSGKTRLIEYLTLLTRRPLAASYMTAAVVFRLIDARQPTRLLDEFDTFFAGDERLRGLLNAGFDRANAAVWVCVGDDRAPTEFSVWAPMVIAGIGAIPDTVADRSIRIALDRKPRDSKVARLRRRDQAPLQELAQKCARWALDNVAELSGAEPKMPAELNDRAQDAWETLVAIADIAGGHWSDWARQAAKRISGDGELTDTESVGVLLLSDIRDLFNTLNLGFPDKTKQALHSTSIVTKLAELEERPWPEFKRGAPITPTQMAYILLKYHITPSTIMIHGVQSKGYHRAAFEVAWVKYLPPIPTQEGPQTVNPSTPEDFCGSQPVSEAVDVGITDAQPVNPSTPKDFCGDGPDYKPEFDNSTNIADTSVSAKVDGLTGCEPLVVGGAEESVSNGSDTSFETTISDMVQTIRAKHPDWSVKRIARTLKLPHARIAKYINEPDAPQNAADDQGAP